MTIRERHDLQRVFEALKHLRSETGYEDAHILDLVITTLLLILDRDAKENPLTFKNLRIE